MEDDFCDCANRRHDRHGRCLNCGLLDKETQRDMDKAREALKQFIADRKKP